MSNSLFMFPFLVFTATRSPLIQASNTLSNSWHHFYESAEDCCKKAKMFLNWERSFPKHIVKIIYNSDLNSWNRDATGKHFHSSKLWESKRMEKLIKLEWKQGLHKSCLRYHKVGSVLIATSLPKNSGII